LEKSIMRVENQGAGFGAYEAVGECGAEWVMGSRRVKGRGSIHFEYFGREAKKRPSVETEGRLTIACHMKILQKIDVGESACTDGTKIMTRTYSENISMIPNG
jgi:hypothetical protein